MIKTDQITGLILAGGHGSRMGGVDKGLQLFRGYPLVMHTLLRIAPQVGPILISANRNVDVYASLGHSIVQDELHNAGPLGGLHAAIKQYATPYLLMVPCDTPFLPKDLINHLAEALTLNHAAIAVARCDGNPQPVVCLLHLENPELGKSLDTYLGSGERKVGKWQKQHQVTYADFPDCNAFRNLNTLLDLE